MRTITLTCVLGFTGLLATSASADISLEEYSFRNIPNNTDPWASTGPNEPSLAPAVVATGILANSLTRGPALTGDTTGDAPISKEFIASTLPSTPTLDLGSGAYISWGFSVPAGGSAAVSTVYYYYAGQSWGGGPYTGPAHCQLFYTLDGGSTLYAVDSSANTMTINGTGGGGKATDSVNINVSSGQTVEFRLYIWAATQSYSWLFMKDVLGGPSGTNNGVEVLGTFTAVPAPGSGALVVAASAWCARRRRH